MLEKLSTYSRKKSAGLKKSSKKIVTFIENLL